MRNNGNDNRAGQTLLSDLVENILKYSDNPRACAEYLTTQIRELIGIRMVAFVSNEAGKGRHLMAICPLRKKDYWNHQPALQQFITGALAYEAPRLIHPETDPAGQTLSSIGIGTSFVIPLMVGAERVGLLVLLDILDQRGAAIILDTLARVSRILALILKNAFLFRDMEQKVAERTLELHTVNAQLKRELAERKQAEKELYRLNRELLAISNCNQVMMRAVDEQSLLDDICRIVCNEAGYHMAWVGYAENDDARTVRVVAWAGVEDGYLANADITWADTKRGRGPTGTAIRNGESACIQDFAADPKAAPWRENALARGYRSSIALPLKGDKGAAFGALMIYATAPNAFTPDEVRLLEKLADDLAFGIAVLRDRNEGRRNDAVNASRLHLLQFAATHSLNELIEETLNEVEKLTGSQIGFYHFVDDDQESLSLQNWSTRTKAEFCKAEGKGLHYPISKAGVWGECVYQRKPVIHNDYASLARRKGMPEGHAMVIRELVVPVLRGGKIKAILSVGNKPTGYMDKDVEVVSLLADLTWEIAERKRGDEALRESEEKYRTLIQKLQAAVVVHAADTRIVTCNPVAQTLLGLTQDQLLGKTAIDSPWHFYREDGTEMPQTEYPVHRVLATRRPLGNVVVGVHRPGNEQDVWVMVNANPVFGRENEISEIIVTFIDITDRKATEEALNQLNRELDRRVLERTAELEAANKEMHAFTYTVSHDLRAPLRHIDGFIGLLQKKVGTALDEQGRHYMDAISGAANKMGLLIDDLLSFSRMARHTMAFKPVELGLLVRDIIRELEPDAAGRTIDWRIGDVPKVSGDASMLRMVLSNLIANALKFTRPREQAQIEIGSLPGRGAEAVIFVRDNGVGFDMNYTDKLFGVFQRLHRADEFEGTGIGLASVRRIIARHGGQIWAEGQVDKGAAFYFSLPQSSQGA